MAGQGNDNNKTKSKIYLERLAQAVNKLKISEKKEPELFEIKNLLNDEKTRVDKKDRITMLAFNYLNSNKNVLFNGNTRDKYEIFFCLMAVNDGPFARKFRDNINGNEKNIRKLEISKMLSPLTDDYRGLPLEPKDMLNKLDVAYVRGTNAEPLTTEEAVSIKNLKSLYKVMTGKADSIFYYNTDDYNEMVRAIKNTINYAENGTKDHNGDVTVNVDKKVLKEMFKNVSEKTAKYIKAKEALPSSDHGKLRLKAAFGALYSVDRAKSGELLLDNANRRDAKWEHFKRMMTGMFEERDTSKYGVYLTEKDIIAEMKIADLDKVAKIDTLEKDIKAAQNKADKAYGMGRADALAEYFIKRTALNELLQSTKDVSLNKAELNKNKNILIHSDAFVNTVFNEIASGEFDYDRFYDKSREAIKKEQKEMEKNKGKTVRQQSVDLSALNL